MILVAWVIWGLGATFESGAFQAWITDEVGRESVGPVFVRGSQAALAGGVVGVLASFAIATVSIRAAIFAAGGVTAAIGVVTLTLMPEAGFRPMPRGGRTRRRAMLDTALKSVRLVRRAPTLLLLVTATVFVGAASEGFDRLSQAHLLRDVGVPTLAGLDPLWWFAVLSIGSTVLALLASTLLVRRLSLPVYATWLNRSVPDSSVRATVNSIASQADAIGQTAGGPVVGAIGKAVTLPAALVASALFYVPLLGLYRRAARRHGREPELANLRQALETGT